MENIFLENVGDDDFQDYVLESSPGVGKYITLRSTSKILVSPNVLDVNEIEYEKDFLFVTSHKINKENVVTISLDRERGSGEYTRKEHSLFDDTMYKNNKRYILSISGKVIERSGNYKHVVISKPELSNIFSLVEKEAPLTLEFLKSSVKCILDTI